MQSSSFNTPLLSSLCLLNWIIIFFISKTNLSYRLSKRNKLFRNLFLLLFVVFAFWAGDFYHTYDDYPILLKGASTHYEDIYNWIASNFQFSYWTFRAIVWGTGLFFLSKIFSFFPISNNLQWHTFSIFGLIWFSYARVSLAISLIFLGFSFLFGHSKSKNTYHILGLFFIFISFYFHKSALFGIGIVILTLLSQKFSNKKFILFIFLSFGLIFILNGLLNQLLTLDSNDYNTTGQSLIYAQKYLTQDSIERGISYYFLKTLENSSYLLISFIGMKCIFNNELSSKLPIIITSLIRVSLLITTAFCVLSFDLGLDTSTFAGRFLRFNFIPCSILLAYFLQYKIYPFYTKIAYKVSLLSTLGTLIYAAYCFIASN